MAEASWKVRVVSMIATIASASIGGWLAVQATDRDIPTIIQSSEPASPVVARGSDLRVEYSVYRRRSCAVAADQFIIDSLGTRFMLPDIEIKAGLELGEARFALPVPVPLDAAPGQAVYKISPNYMCNPIQRLWPIVAGARDVRFFIK